MKFKIYCIFCVCVLRQLQWRIKKDMSRPATLRLIINGKSTTMVLRGLCILYGVWLLKVCHFYFLFFREDISVTNKVDGEHSWWPRFGAAPGFCRWLWILWLLVFFHHYVSVVTSIQSFFVRVSPYWKKNKKKNRTSTKKRFPVQIYCKHYKPSTFNH